MSLDLEAFTNPDFWIGVGVFAGVYAVFTLGLQLNVGFTGILNFGQTGFMAIGAYAMGILTIKAGWSFWAALPAATLIAVAFGFLIGLPSLRLRAEYLAITTLAFAEIVRFIAQNARGLTGGNQGLFGYTDDWTEVSIWAEERLAPMGMDYIGLPLLLVTWTTFLVLMVLFVRLQRSPWGRVLRAIREDEDAASALGKNAFVFKLQSLGTAAATGAIAGYFLALDLTIIYPTEFEPLFTVIAYATLVLGGLASYGGVAVGAALLWIVLEALRFLNLPFPAEKVASLRFMVVGIVLMVIMAIRPQGLMGRREEMVHRE